MRSFLDLISSENPESNYPYSTPEYREMFRHTLWMVPGVKEASALSRLLKDHPVFGAYKVANVAGDGDAEMPYDNALTLVKQVIKANRYTITISCGKLTTGVTVKPWTGIFCFTSRRKSSSACRSIEKVPSRNHFQDGAFLLWIRANISRRNRR